MSQSTPRLTVGVVGYGRFGRVLVDLLKPHANVLIQDPALKSLIGGHIDSESTTTRIVSDKELAQEADLIILCVPMRNFNVAIHTVFYRLRGRPCVVMDTCSVKVWPTEHMLKCFDESVQLIASHPVFGPDSVNEGGELRVIMHPVRCEPDSYAAVQALLRTCGMTPIEMTPEDHDRQAAFSQGLTHYIGRIVAGMELTPSATDTLGTKRLHQIMEQTCNDTWHLFTDMQRMNPYAEDMRRKLDRVRRKIEHRILPERVNTHDWVFGIQGIPGSFNEEAIRAFQERKKLAFVHIEYKVTTKGVLKALHTGEVDRGIFAVQNSIRGLVLETFEALTEFNCKALDTFWMPVRQCLLVRKGVKREDITEFASHVQALGQCSKYLAREFPDVPQKVTRDTAWSAKMLHQGRFAETTAVIGSARCAEIYPSLEVLEADIHDDPSNNTQFVVVCRR